jgi:hypothetical protein
MNMTKEQQTDNYVEWLKSEYTERALDKIVAADRAILTVLLADKLNDEDMRRTAMEEIKNYYKNYMVG